MGTQRRAVGECIVVRDNEGGTLAHTVKGTGAGVGTLGQWGRGYEHTAGELGKQVIGRQWCHPGERLQAGQDCQSQCHVLPCVSEASLLPGH